MKDAILQECPRLEIYNSSFTSNFGEWALGFCGEVYVKDNPRSLHQSERTLQNVTSLDLSNRHINTLVNKVSISSLYTLFLGLLFPIFIVIYSSKLNISLFIFSKKVRFKNFGTLSTLLEVHA